MFYSISHRQKLINQTLTFAEFDVFLVVYVSYRDKKQIFFLNDKDLGMKEAQKQDIVQNGRIFRIFIINSLWNVGMGIEFQIFFHSE